jgi:Tat protein translocase TatB subunit
MFGIGITELIIIAVVALLVVGPKRLPDLAKSMGKGLAEFKRTAEDVTDGIKESLQTDDIKEHTNDMKDSLEDSQQNTDPPPPIRPLTARKKRTMIRNINQAPLLHKPITYSTL